jgi:hypothetical protein
MKHSWNHSISYPVYSNLIFNNLVECVEWSRVIGIVDVNVVTLKSGCKDPVSSVVYIQDNDVISTEIVFDLTSGDFAQKGNSQGVDGRPHE